MGKTSINIKYNFKIQVRKKNLIKDIHIGGRNIQIRVLSSMTEFNNSTMFKVEKGLMKATKGKNFTHLETN